MTAILGGLVFGCIVFLSIEFCKRLWAPGPRGGLRSELLRAALCSAAAVIGGILLSRAAPPETLAVIAILSATLGATCYLVTLEGKIPAALVGATLAIIVGSALLQGDWGPLISAAVTGLPFAVAPFTSRENHADWRDAIVAALGGAAFGVQFGIVVVTLACVAIIVARPYLARRRATPQPPARFSSALAAAFLIALLGQIAVT